MKGYIVNIEKITKENNNFRKVLYTAKNSQLVVMSINPKEDIGEETHDLDQFIRIEEGRGRAVLNGVETDIEDNYAIVIPAGTKHNIINTSEEKSLKLYSGEILLTRICQYANVNKVRDEVAFLDNYNNLTEKHDRNYQDACRRQRIWIYCSRR